MKVDIYTCIRYIYRYNIYKIVLYTSEYIYLIDSVDAYLEHTQRVSYRYMLLAIFI